MRAARRTRAAGLVVLAAVASLSTACSNPLVAESAAARARLVADVARVRWCAIAHQPEAAASALVTLRRDIARFESEGQLSSSTGQVVLAAAAGVQHTLHLLAQAEPASSTSTTTTSTTTTLPPAPTSTAPPVTAPAPTAPPPPPDGGGKGHGHHGKDKGGDGGGN